MAARRQHHFDFTRKQAGAGKGGAPWHDVVLARRQHVGRHVDAPEIDRNSAHVEAPRHSEVVLEVHVTHVIDIHRAGQVGAVAVPVEKVECLGCAPLEIVVDHVLPDEIVGTQAGERERELAAVQHASLRELPFAPAHIGLIHEHAELTRVAEIKHRGKHCGACDGFVAARALDGERRPEQRAAHAETKRIDLWRSAYLACNRERFQHALLEIIVPGRMSHFPGHVAP